MTVNTAAIAKLCGVSPRTVQRWVNLHDMPFFGCDQWTYDPVEVADWLESHTFVMPPRLREEAVHQLQNYRGNNQRRTVRRTGGRG
jgi:phage terminase Nu1 subunit (DNA packaging protein)